MSSTGGRGGLYVEGLRVGDEQVTGDKRKILELRSPVPRDPQSEDGTTRVRFGGGTVIEGLHLRTGSGAALKSGISVKEGTPGDLQTAQGV